MSKHVLFTNATTTGSSDLINIGHVTPITFVVEASADYVASPDAPALQFEEAEFASDTIPTAAINNLPRLGAATGTDATTVSPGPLVAGAKQVYHIQEADWLAVRATIVNAPAAGSISVRLYVPDGR